MSKKVDERVVEMRFDNKQFESNVQTSMSTIDKLKQKLNFKDASKGFDNISGAAKKVDMKGLGSAVEGVRVKFSALGVMGVTALANITNSAVNAGKRIVSALTIDPIKSGFQEYETQINAIQTILANTQSKGSTLGDVNKALAELNTYADKTIYNFTEMTRNIGTFTAAGVGLETSVSSIKGLANLAAVSGSNATQASTAMYQLSQAIANGKVNLQDWNSVVNAGMGGELFQTALKRTAEHFGTNVDGMIEKYGSFRESLTRGEWLTTEILTETLTQLSGAYSEADLIAQGYTQEQAKQITQLAETAVNAATKVKTFTQLWDTMQEAAQSGWTRTWEIMIGDFDEAQDLLTEISEKFGDIISKQADARNDLLYESMSSNWKKLSDEITDAGLSVDDFKDKIIEVGKAHGVDMDGIIADYGSLEKAFKSGALSSELLDEALVKMTGTSEELKGKLADLRGEYKTNEDILNALTKAGYEQSDIHDLVAKSMNGETIALNDLSDAQLMSIGYTADQVKEIRELSKYAELADGSVKELTKNIAVPSGRENLIDSFRIALESLIDIFGAVRNAWRDVFPPMSADRLYGMTQAVHDFVSSMKPTEQTLNNIQRTFRGFFSVLDIGAQLIGSVAKGIAGAFGSLKGVGGSLLEVTASFGDWLTAIDKGIKAGEGFSVVTTAISGALNGVFTAISGVLKGLGGFTGVLSKIGDVVSKVFGAIGKAASWFQENVSLGDIFMGIGTSAIVSGVISITKKISKITDALKNMFDGFGEVGGSFSAVLESVSGALKSFQQGIKVASLLGIATAVTLLVSSLRKISELSPADIAVSLVTIRLLIASLNSGFGSLAKTLSKFNAKGTIKSSIAMIGIATAINVLASAMKKIADLNMSEIIRGLAGIGGMLLELSLAVRLIGNGGVTLRTSIALLALAEACKMLGDALGKFGAMSWGEIIRGLTGMGGALVIFVAALKTLSKAGGFGAILGGTALLIAVQSLNDISEGLERLGNLSWGNIARGLTAMGGALVEFTAALSVLSKVGGFGAALGGTAILIAAQSLDEISNALERLGFMSWGEIARGLTAMGGALAELATVSGLLGKLAGGSGLLGAGALVIGVQALGKLASALQAFGSMQWSEIARGLAGMGGALAELAVVSGLLGKLGGFSALIGATTLVVGVQSLVKMADALKVFGSMEWGEVARGLVGMGGALTELAVVSSLLGKLGGLSALVGGGALLLAVQGLGDLADALAKFGSMQWDEIGRGLTAMGAALGEAALGGLLNTLSGLGAISLEKIAPALGVLADSVKKWSGISIPEDLGKQIGSLGKGIRKFTFDGLGADAISTVAAPLGTMADSVRKWSGVSVPENLGTQIGSLADGVKKFTFGGFGADAISTVAAPLGTLADSVQKWSGVSIPSGVGENLAELASGVKAFSFAFVGGISMDSVVEPLSNLAGAVQKWSGISVPSGVGEGLSELASGVKSFSFAFVGGWSIDSIQGPLGGLADSVRKWNGITISGIGPELETLSAGLKSLTAVPINAKFVDNFSNLFNSFANESVGSAVNNINTMVDALNRMSSIDMGGISTFSTALENLGKVSIDGLVASLQNGAAQVGSAVQTIVSSMTNALSGASIAMGTTALSVGKTIGDNIVSGIKVGTANLGSSISATMSSAASSVASQTGSFQKAGNAMGQGLVSGFKSGSSSFASSIGSVVSSAVSIASAKAAAFRTVGTNLATGLSSGFKSGASTLTSAINTLMTSAINAIQSKTGQFQSSGTQLSQALARGIVQGGQTIVSSLNSMLNQAVAAIRSKYGAFQAAGSYAVSGMAAGIRSQQGAAVAAARAMASAVEQAAKVKLDIHSPSRVFRGIGVYTVLGLIKGIEDETQHAKETSADLGDAIVKAIQKELKINSPSKVTRDEVGRFVVDGIAEGIEENTSAEEAATKKAQNIINAFKTELDKFDLDMATSDLELELWERLYGDFGYGDGKSRVDFIADKFKLYMEKAQYAQAEYKATLATFGENAEETQQAYNKFLQSKLDFVKFAEDVNEKYDDISIDVKSVLMNMQEIDVVIDTIDSVNKTVEKEAPKIGESMSKGVTTGVQQSTASVTQTTDNMMKESVAKVTASEPQWKDAGAKITNALIEGMRSNIQNAANAAAEIAKTAYQSAMNAIGQSGSFAGMNDFYGAQDRAKASSVAKSVSNSVSKIASAINSGIDTDPVIHPVLDLSDVESKAGTLNSIMKQADLAGGISKSVSATMSKSNGQNGSDTSTNAPKGDTYTFTQNNYSPKALSSIDIYRQTKNQFSALERVTNK